MLLSEMKTIMDVNVAKNDSVPYYHYFEDYNISVKDSLTTITNWEYSLAVPPIFLVFMITGTLGNGLVVLVFIKNKVFRTITNMFLLNLAVTDLVYLIFCVPFAATRYFKAYWMFGNILCKYFLLHFFIYNSLSVFLTSNKPLNEFIVHIGV